jgi:mono/diheme cytochrome c family protein
MLRAGILTMTALAVAGFAGMSVSIAENQVPAASQASAMSAASAVSAREKYVLFCAGCHGYEGEGGGGGGGQPHIPSLKPDAGVFLRDRIGRAYLVNVGGVSSAGMSDAETATVLNFVLTEFAGESLPADFKPYTGAEVGALRSTLADPVATRKEIRKRLESRGYKLPPYQWES